MTKTERISTSKGRSVYSHFRRQDGGGAAYSFTDASRGTGSVACEFAEGKLDLHASPGGARQQVRPEGRP